MEFYNEKSIIIVSGYNKKRMIALRFKKENGKLLAYNFYLPEENRKEIEVLKINGFDITNLIDKINAEDFFDKEIMNSYGIDISSDFLLTVKNEEGVILYNIYDDNANDDIFYKKYDNNEKMNLDSNEYASITNPGINTMMEYANTNSLALINILKNMSSSNQDKEALDSLFIDFKTQNDSYNNVLNNLDIIYLSNMILMLDDKITHIPSIAINYINKLNLYIDVNNNRNIMTNGQVDYKKLIKKIRDSLAHSNYKVLSNGDIEFYDDGKNNYNFLLTIPKSKVFILFDMLYKFHYLFGTLPIIKSKPSLEFKSMDENELLKYLKDIKLFNIEDYKLKELDDEKLQEELDDDLGLDTLELSSRYTSEMIYRSYDSKVKRHIDGDKELEEFNLSDEDIKYILMNIKEMDEAYFYKLGISEQKNVIKNLIQMKYNREYYLFENINGMFGHNYFSSDSLTKKASSYINYKSKIELTILSLLNNLFVFCFNKNNTRITDITNKSIRIVDNADKIKFPTEFYKNYLESKKSMYLKEVQELEDTHALFKSTIMNGIDNNLRNEFMKRVNNTNFKIYNAKVNMERAYKIMNNSASNDEVKIVNSEILERIRNSLGHGNVRIGNIDINNIMQTKISFVDDYDNSKMFSGSISLFDLMNSINQVDFMNSFITNNTNFLSHS